MRSESCRKCGVEMVSAEEESQICQICKEPTFMQCPKCMKLSEPQIHNHPIYC